MDKPNRCYAYGIMSKGRKRIGGTIHAASMEDAVDRIAMINGVTIDLRRDSDGVPNILGPRWMMDGGKVSLYVWASPEYHVKTCKTT